MERTKGLASGLKQLSYKGPPCLARGMEDDPDYRQVTRYMAAFIVLPIMGYGIIRMLFHLLAG